MRSRRFEEIEIISFLENLVGKRFDFKELKAYLKVNCKDFIIELVEKDMTDYDIDLDFELVGSLQNVEKDILCDFDIYYAKTRNGKMYITEVGYEF